MMSQLATQSSAACIYPMKMRDCKGRIGVWGEGCNWMWKRFQSVASSCWNIHQECYSEGN